MEHASGPSLPEEYNNLVNKGFALGPNAGTCGSAAYLKQRVIVTDILNSPNWTPYPEFIGQARKHNLRASWSEPIISADGQLLGTIANYSSELGEPNANNLDALKWAADVAAIAIEKTLSHQAIRESEEKFRNLANSAKVMISIIAGKDGGKYLFVNDESCRILGYSKEEVMKMRPIDFVVPEYRHIVLGNAAKRIEGEPTPPNYELKIITKSGETRHLDFSSTIINIGNQKAFLTTSIDITDRKMAEENIRQAHETYLGIINSVTESIYIQDENGVFLEVNNAAMKSYGLKREELIGQTPEILSAPSKNDLRAINTMINKALNGEPQRFEFWGARADGTIFPDEVTLTNGVYFGKRALIAVARDITERKKADQALRESEEKYRTLFETMNEGVLYQAKDGSFIEANQLAINLLGVSEDVFFGRAPIPPGWKAVDSKKNLLPLEKQPSMVALSSKKPVLNQEIGVFNPNTNTYTWLLVNAIPQFRPGEEEPYRAFVTMSDITGLKLSEENLKERNAFIQTVLDNLPIGVALNTMDEGRATYMNDKFKEIYGWDEEDIINIETFFEKVYPDEGYRKKWMEQIFADIQSGDPGRMHWENISIKRKDGTTGIINAVNIPLVGQNTMVSTVMDVTKEKMAEEIQKELEIAHKTARFKQNFLANMSHEIRTPLTGVLGMIEILQHTPLSEEQRDYLNIIKTSGENLSEIINQVLDYSKIEAGKVDIQQTVFGFGSLISDTENLYKNRLKEGVQLKTDTQAEIPDYIKADRFRLLQVLNNLVSNALKFTKQGSVTIRSTLQANDAENKKATIKVEVIDTGIGIAATKHKKLFAPFSQIDDADIREYEGTGLGLSICKQLVELMGGEIGVTSQEGKGSNFWFTFPASIAPQPPIAQPKAGNTTAEKKLNILFAEDKVVNQKVVNLMLTSMGHTVVIAGNGQEAVEMFRPGRFDIILMDIQMPIMDGVTATRQLKEKYTDLPPIIGLSANAFEGDREKYMALGMDEYLTKPVKKGDFEDLIGKLFKAGEG